VALHGSLPPLQRVFLPRGQRDAVDRLPSELLFIHVAQRRPRQMMALMCCANRRVMCGSVYCKHSINYASFAHNLGWDGRFAGRIIPIRKPGDGGMETSEDNASQRWLNHQTATVWCYIRAQSGQPIVVFCITKHRSPL